MLHPLNGRILIKPELAPTQTDSGLHLVEHWSPENIGEVVAVAEYVKTTCPECGSTVGKECSVTAGDVVVFPQDAGQEMRVDGERFLLLRDEDILGVVETL